jgi:hypothetical protein
MKYRLPRECLAVSHAGKQLSVGADGTLDLDAAAAADLLPHGVLPASDAKPAVTTSVSGKPADGPGDKRMTR